MDNKESKNEPPPPIFSTGSQLLSTVTGLTSKNEQSGMVAKKYRFLPKYGKGQFYSYHIKGLSIRVFDVRLKRDIKVQGKQPKRVLELTYLIDGEKIIKVDGKPLNFVMESQECYLVYLDKVSGCIRYYKKRHLKEIKIQMDEYFIEKHGIDQMSDINKKYGLEKAQYPATHLIDAKEQSILSEILSEHSAGLRQRLLLEAKVLELLYFKLNPDKNHPKSEGSNDHIIKKLYRIQSIISNNLDVQYSIQNLARQVGLNEFILKKEFKRVFGQTIFEYSTSLKMENAKRLLLYSKKPIYEIAGLTGYKNPTHFTAAFKKYEGTTPKLFRKGKTEQ